jgi:hypothetical protein
MRTPNQSCQPTPGGRLSRFLSVLARRGCTLRWVKMCRYVSLAATLMALCARAGTGEPPSNTNYVAILRLGHPEWFTNIRNERLVRAIASVTNSSSSSLWCVAYGKTNYWWDCEWRSPGEDQWRLFNSNHFDATHARVVELLPGAAWAFPVALNGAVRHDVRVRLRFYRTVKNYPQQKWLPALEQPVEVASNAVRVGSDPASTQPDAAPNAARPHR